MMETCDIAKETIELLKYFDKEFTSKISKSFINLLKKLAEKSRLEIKIDLNKKINEQEISEECKDLIALIYYSCFADSDEKEVLLKIWKENDNVYQHELDEKYDISNIFKDRNKLKKQNDEVENILSVEVKKSFFKRILEKIKEIFRT